MIVLCSVATLATGAPRTHAGPGAVLLGCDGRSAFRSFDLPPDDEVLVLENGSAARAWLELKEAGQSIELDGARKADRLQVRAPPRYAWSFVPLDANERLTIRRFDATHAAGKVSVALHCTLDAALQGRIDWFRAASQVSASVRAPADEAGYTRIIESIESLRESAADAMQKALAQHLHAQALLVNGHNADASVAFGQADAAWQAAGETERALAARVGRVEDANLAARYSETLELTKDVRSVETGRGGYFGVRLEASRCLALWYLDRTDEAARCYAATLAGFERLAELPEYANVLRDYADLQLQLGNNAEAERLARHAIELARGHKPLIIGAYLERLLGDLAMRRGALAESLGHFDRALTLFEQAQAPQRSLANVDMQIASIYEELGAYDEALSHLASAVKHYTMRDAPARMAGAMVRFSRLERDLGHIESARLWSYVAESAFAALQMPSERDAARIDSLALQLARGDIATVRARLGQFGPLQATERISLDLIGAEVAIDAGDNGVARAKLDALRSSALTVHQGMQLAQVEARYWNALGDRQRALTELAAAAGKITALVRSTRSPVLASVLSRQLLPLRRLALQLLLEAGDAASPDRSTESRQTLEAVWMWLTIDAVQPASGRGVGARSAEESFDRAIAEELLGPADAHHASVESPARRSLLQIMARASAPASVDVPRAVSSLEQFQARLAADAAFIAYVDAGSVGALLWVTRAEARLVDAGKPDDVRAAARALRGTLLSAAAPLDRIDAAARRFSAELLRAVPQGPPPRQLTVMVEEPLNGVAWSVVPWRASATPLIETSTVRLLNPATSDAAVAAGNRALHVLVAAQKSGAGKLSALDVATVEPALITQAAAGRQVTVSSGGQFTRASLLAALDDGGAWVHVAAHGMTRPQRIGYAGVWLEPASATASPQFVSWLDVLDSGVRSDLVVLDACDLDDRGEALDGNLSFASAVSRAGAHWVLAAMWPVSDAAAALWVPEFYAQAANGDVAASLHAAQLRLRSSRAFRHPYFWAGMQATERWSVADVAGNARSERPGLVQ